MKTTTVRLSVLALAFVGFAASSVVSHSQKIATTGQVRVACVGTPLCAPSDPSHCGMH